MKTTQTTPLSGIVSRPVGQREPLTVRLKSLVRGYPKGLGIIKEFLQNADDARASYLHVVMDWRTHGTRMLPNERYAELCGPALLFANDAVFSDDDFKGIQEIGQSVKQHAPAKIGKFGLGFNAAYNVTDFPTFLSRDKLCVFDPHLCVVDDSSRDPGIEYTLNGELWTDYSDLLTPFRAGGLELGATNLRATIFRLPIRSISRAQSSEISTEAFTAEDFDKILRHLRDAGSDLLLFLQSVHALRVTVIDEGGQEQTVLAVNTLNIDEVKAGRGAVAHWLAGATDTTSILESLREPGDRPLNATFRHDMWVQDGLESYKATWLATVGVHRGPDNVLLTLAEEMSADGDRALPVAGAAARLVVDNDDTVKVEPIRGRAYCGLPLPRLTGLNIHINGYFELDAARDWLRLNPESVGRHEQQRLKWNRALLEHGVATAVAALMVALVDQAPGASPADRYALWPDPTETNDAVLPGLTKATYSQLWRGERAVISVDPEERGLAPVSKVTILPSDWWSQLRQPLSAAGWKVANPELPSHVKAGFAGAGLNLQALTPAQLRDEWRQKKDVNCELANAPNAAWRDRAWVTTLLRFCLSDGSNQVNGLPFALLCDGRLHTFGLTPAGVTFIATDEQRRIFSQFPSWFIDPALAEASGLSAIVGAKSLAVMTAANVLANLKRVLGTDGEPKALFIDAIPNEEWLGVVFKYLADSRALGIAQNVEYFKLLAVIPDQFGRLHQPGTTSTPLWQPTKSSKAAIGAALTAFRVPVVSGPTPMLKLLERALDASSDPVVWGVTPRDLIDVLHGTQSEWGEQAASYSAEIHEPLIDFIANQEVDNLDEDQIARLAELRIFPTRDRKLVTPAKDGVFLAEDAKLPNPPGDRQLFMARPVAWRRLLRKAGAPVLDALTVIEAMLDEGIEGLAKKRQRELLTWLRDNFDRILTGIGEEEGERLSRRIGAARFFPGDDGGLHAASTLYDPSVSVAREILGPSAVFLALDGSLADHPALWRSFCQRLGMATTLRPDDLIAYVDRLVGQASAESVDSVADALLGVFEHVREHWSALVAIPLESCEHDTLAEALANRAWLPAQTRKEKLSGFAGAVAHENRLYSPSELYAPNMGHLVSSQAPLAPFAMPSKEVRSALGFPTVAPISTVIAHLEHVLNAWHSEEGEKPATESLKKTLGAIYRDLGNRLGGESASEVDDEEAIDRSGGSDTTVEDVRARFAGVPCLWDDRLHRFWPPEQVFTLAGWLGHRRARLSNANQQQDRGYTVLGRRLEPGTRDLLDLLDEIAHDSSGDPLGADDIQVVISVLRHIDATARLGELERAIPLLSRDDCLVMHSQVYDDDAGAYTGSIRPGAIHIVHPEVPRRLRATLGIRSLANALHRELANAPVTATDDRALRYCADIEETIRSQEFSVGLRRFLSDRCPEASHLTPSWLRTVEVCVVEPFETILRLEEDGRRREVGSGPSQFHFDSERLTMYVSVDAYDAAASLIARGIEQQLGMGSLGDLSPLSDILRAAPNRIDALLTTLSVRAAPEGGSEFWESQRAAEDGLMSFGDVEEELDDSFARELETESGVEAEELRDEELNGEYVRPEDPAEDLKEDAFKDEEFKVEEFKDETSVEQAFDSEDTAAAEGVDGNFDAGDQQSIVTDAPIHRFEDGEHPLRSAVSEDFPSGNFPPSSRRDPRLVGPSAPRRQGDRGVTDGSSLETPHFPAADSRPAGTGVPDPEARQSRPRESFEGATQSSRDLGESRASARTPHPGSSRRVVTYIVSAADVQAVESDSSDDESPVNMIIGGAAEEYVAAEEARAGRLVERMPHNNPGYDIFSAGGDPGDVRFIEVKGVSGEWGAAGVPLSARQFDKAWKEREKFWLYVVEFAQDPVRRRVTRLQDPVGKVTQYRVDSGWRSLGTETEGKAERQAPRSSQPAAGDHVTLLDGRSGTILEVRGVGMLAQLSVQFSDGDVERALYKPDRMTVTKRAEN